MGVVEHVIRSRTWQRLAWLGLCLLALAIWTGVVAGTAQAHVGEADHTTTFNLEALEPEWIEASGNTWLQARVRISDDHPSVTGPDGTDQKPFGWALFAYEYVEGSAFACKKELFDAPQGLGLESWLQENGYAAGIYEIQKDVFLKKSGIGLATTIDANTVEAATWIQQEENLERYTSGQGTLGLCLLGVHLDNSHSSLDSLTVDFASLAGDNTDVVVENSNRADTDNDQQPAAETENQLELVDSSTDGDSDGAAAAGTGDEGGDDTKASLPPTGLAESLGNQMFISIAAALGVVAVLVPLVITYKAKMHRRN